MKPILQRWPEDVLHFVERCVARLQGDLQYLIYAVCGLKIVHDHLFFLYLEAITMQKNVFVGITGHQGEFCNRR